MGNTYDRLNQARHGLLIVTVLTIVAAVVLAVSAGQGRRDSLDVTGRIINVLNLSAPALFPSGHARRDAGYAHPAVDLRHSPHLPAANQRNTQ